MTPRGSGDSTHDATSPAAIGGLASSPERAELQSAGRLAMPALVRELAGEWPSLVGTVPGLTSALERDLRFGHRVMLGARGYVIGGSQKGGSSSVYAPTSDETFEVYEAWRRVEGLVGPDDPAAFERLAALLSHHGKGFFSSAGGRDLPATYVPERSAIYRVLLGVLEALPESHLARSTLRGIRLGGWGPDGAKASAFDEGYVHLYDFALRGARRTLAGLFLHELGHALEVDLSGGDRAHIVRAHAAIARHGGLLGLEWLGSPADRVAYQESSVVELVAETYLAYTAAGGRLREHIRGAPEPAREPWRVVYSCFVRAFEGREYL